MLTGNPRTLHVDVVEQDHQRRVDKPGFFSRKIATILRRPTVAVDSAHPSGNPADAFGRAAPLRTAEAMAAALPRRARVTPGVSLVAPEVVLGTKNYAVASTNGIRAVNEDRFRVITNLELYGRGLVSVDRRIATLPAARESRMLERFQQQQGDAPHMDVKKLLKLKAPTTASSATELFGIYDGHGGADCSSLLALLLPLYLLLAPEYASNLAAAAHHACLAINAEILQREAAAQSQGGSTALTVLIRHGTAFLCNVGDCRAILISRDGVRALTTDHKAANETEKQRIEDAGGMVLYVKGVPRVNGQLAVSRAFGDAEHHEFVIAEPEVTRHVFTPADEYIVLASDGLWDVMANEDVMACIRNHPWLSIDEMAQVLIDRAVELGSNDNVTVMILDARRR